MRNVRMLVGLTLLFVGLSLAVAVLYDATALTRLAGLSPEDAEAAVALAGLGLAITTIASGAVALRRPRPRASAAG
jgi:predicted MFS family arabinose efflux permease